MPFPFLYHRVVSASAAAAAAAVAAVDQCTALCTTLVYIQLYILVHHVGHMFIVSGKHRQAKTFLDRRLLFYLYLLGPNANKNSRFLSLSISLAKFGNSICRLFVSLPTSFRFAVVRTISHCMYTSQGVGVKRPLGALLPRRGTECLKLRDFLK